MTVSPARRSAFEILRRVEAESAFASVLLATLDANMREDDRALCHELVLGVLRRRLWLDRSIEHFGNRSAQKLDLPVRLALEIGLYQLRFLTRIPSSAAVNESVNLVRASRLKSAAGFVNAVLRRATRDPIYDPATEIQDSIEKLSIETSHPRWLIERWVNAFGFDEAREFARTNNQPAPAALRLTARTQRDEQARKRTMPELESASAELTPSKMVPGSWRVAGAGSVLRELVDEGLIYLQDEASQLLAHLLHVGPGHRVLDVTAAPGSKATHIAALAPEATVVTGDIHPRRAKTMQRLALKQDARIHVIQHDATKPLPFSDESFDRVLLDAPCSGTGTLRRHPEIRYRLAPEDILQLASQQLLMLSTAARVLRRGGRLIYSTCSVEPEENERVVESFLATHRELVKTPLNAPTQLETPEGYVRTWPNRDGCDGFFIAVLERRD
jgi:16S rRNA (cytosine967-C5)-methyltransferase